GAFYVLLLLTACGIRFSLAERNSGKLSNTSTTREHADAGTSGHGPVSGGQLTLPPDLARTMQPSSRNHNLQALPYISQNGQWNQTTANTVTCSKIAFASARDGNYEIYEMNPDGTNPTRLTNNAFTDDFPDISPNGNKITFESNRTGSFEIWVMN